MKKYAYIIALFFLISHSVLLGQTITVISSNDKHPLPHARIEIAIQNKVYNFLSDIQGNIEIGSAYQNLYCKLTISYPDFNTITIPNIRITKDTTFTLSPTINEYEEVVVTAQYKAQLIENAVHNIAVIDRKQIESMAAQNVIEAINNQLNIHISEDNILGANIQLQGIGGENVKILIDGIPVTGRQNGNIDLAQIPIENIERIEIVEGPLSVNYGTDALAGTINIITKQNQKNTWEITSNNYSESSGKLNNSLSIGGKFKNHQIILNGGRHFFDGWDPSHKIFDYRNPIADSSRVLLWKPKTQLFGGLNYQFRGTHASLVFNGQYLDEKIINRGYPRPPYFETAFDDYYQTQRINQSLDYQYYFKHNHTLSLTAGYSGYFRKKNTKIRDLTTIDDVITSNPDDQDTSTYHSIMLRGRYIQAKDDKKFNYEVGFEILQEYAFGKKILHKHKNIGDYALYTSAEYSPLPSLTFRPGIRYSYNTQYKAPLTPSMNIKWTFFNKDKHDLALRFSYARGFRAPSIKELFYTFVDANHNIIGNKDLKAESSDNFNLSFHENQRIADVVIKNKLSVFYNIIYNQIALAQKSVNEYSYFNINRFTTTGFQFESSILYKGLSAGLGFGYIGRYHKIVSDKTFLNNQFLFSPSINSQIQYNWEKIGLQFALFYRYIGELPQIFGDENGNYTLSIIKDYHLADFKISKYIWNKRLTISVGVKNIFNVINVSGSEGSAISAHSSGGSGQTTIGMGRTYNLGIILKLYSK
ncbi:MAG: TonB-dependent receptor [Brumimicrobium sp.]|nr:TonB-dependent receptor [Brumimicrobium sp.]MCO5268447.1 TonB-dependent receptor [Brumimicrobium sp.]